MWIKFDHKGKGEFGRTGEAQAQAQASDGDRLPLVLLGYDDGLQVRVAPGGGADAGTHTVSTISTLSSRSPWETLCSRVTAV